MRQRYNINFNKGGIVLEGSSMGGSCGVMQAMLLPNRWRKYITWVSGRVGIIMPRRVAEISPGQYASWPPNDKRNKAMWDKIDFSVQAAIDPLVRGIHYRQSFSTNDQFSEGLMGAHKPSL